jgi:hypothetical protein
VRFFTVIGRLNNRYALRLSAPPHPSAMKQITDNKPEIKSTRGRGY